MRRGPNAPSLRRRSGGLREPRLRILIYCEGGRTEPEYFQGLARARANGLVAVETVPAAGVPLTLVEKAIRAKPRGRKHSFEKNDQIWVAFDCDEHPSIDEARAKAKAHDVRIAYCNPCFELWLLLHIRDFDAPASRHELQKLLEGEAPSYKRHQGKSLTFGEIEKGVEDACKRALAMRKRRLAEELPWGPPYTDADELVRIILDNGAC